MELPQEIISIINKLNENGYEAYAVGGCVRDYLLGKTPKDFDIATDATPTAVKNIFRRTADTGLQHGTVTVLVNKRAVEVTTYRIDGEYTDNRRPDNVTFTSELKQDLLRRDFTINAIAYHPKTGYIDYFGGADDLEKKIIRGVGCPEERFREDALRMLRAIRFAAVLGFEIERETIAAAYKNAHLLKSISAERVRDELLKIIASPHPKMLNLLTDTQLLYYFSQPLQEYLDRYADQIIIIFSNCYDNDIVLRLVIFFKLAEPDMTECTLKRLRLDNKTIKAVMTLKIWLDKKIPENLYETKKALSQIGIGAFKQLIRLNEIISGFDLSQNLEMLDSILTGGDCFTIKNLAVNGSDLLKMGLNGKAIGETLNLLLDYVMQNPQENNKQALINYLFSGGFDIKRKGNAYE